jgi:PsbN protein
MENMSCLRGLYLLNSIIKIIDSNASFIMETATVLIIFISSLLLGLTGYSVYTAFGPGSKELRDPFDDHED